VLPLLNKGKCKSIRRKKKNSPRAIPWQGASYLVIVEISGGKTSKQVIYDTRIFVINSWYANQSKIGLDWSM
jgi:hypothetical protein